MDEVGEDEKLGGELTGKTVYIPNLVVLDQAVLNYSVADELIKCNFIFDEVRIPVAPATDVRKAAQLLCDIIVEEDQEHIGAAEKAFGTNYPNFVREAENGPRISIHLEPEKIWINGKFVTPFEVCNQIKANIYLRFIEESRRDLAVRLA